MMLAPFYLKRTDPFLIPDLIPSAFPPGHLPTQTHFSRTRNKYGTVLSQNYTTHDLSSLPNRLCIVSPGRIGSESPRVTFDF